jgi:hypothetical protein
MSEEKKAPVKNRPSLLGGVYRLTGHALAAYALFTAVAVTGHYIVEHHHKPLLAKITLYGVALTGSEDDLINAARLQDLSDDEFVTFLIRLGHDDATIEQMLIRRSMSEKQWKETKALEREVKQDKW